MTTVDTILGALYVDDQGQPDEPTALLWPSLFTDHRMWRHQIAPLREAGWRTLALDPPGHGRSPGPGRRFTMDECAAAVQVLDATGVRSPAVVLGTSWGGFVAPRIAVLAPERLSGMALFNTSAERGTPFERTKATLLTKFLAVGALDKVTARMIVSGLLAPGTQRREPKLGGDLAEEFLAWDRRRFIATVRSVLIDRDPVLDALPELKVPALTVSGKEDHTLPSFHSQRMAQKLPNARHIEVAGATARGQPAHPRLPPRSRRTAMNVVDIRSDRRMVLDRGPGQAYLLRRGPQAVLIHTGIAGQGDAIAGALAGWGLHREALTHVLLTHWHPDHVGSAAEVGTWPNARIWAHRIDAPIIRGDRHGTFPSLTHTGQRFYAQIAGSVPSAPPARVDRELGDDEHLEGLGTRVIYAPGHTDGSVAFLFEEADVLFTGDVATEQQGQVVLGPFDNDRPTARQSFRKFADIEVDTVCFGHGQPLVGAETSKLRAAAQADEVPDPLG